MPQSARSLVAIMVVAVLTACGPGAPPAPSATQAPAAPPAAQPTAAAAPTQAAAQPAAAKPSGKDTLTVVFQANQGTLDPHFAATNQELLVTRNIYNSLLKYKPDSIELTGDLATSW